MKEIPAPSRLPPPLKMTGIGNSHLQISAKPEAQAWFDQGLNLLHDFWDYEAARAFEQGVRVDTQCAMCYWGLYHALIFRNAEASVDSQQALARATQLKQHATEQERLYIDAAAAADAAAEAAAPDGKPDTAKEIGVWRDLTAKYPADTQAKIFLAVALGDGYDDSGAPKLGTMEALTILQEVLKARPDDSAANHYWIHAVEASPHPEQALRSAQLLASLAPASGHMVHMPGHIFYRTGDYASAERWFANSTAVDEAYMRDQHVDVDDDWNYVHNLMYGIANLMEEGKLQQAHVLTGTLSGARGQLAATLYTHSPRDGMTRLDAQLPIALRTGDWSRVLAMLHGVHPDAKLENLNFLAGQLTQFATGMQAIEANDLDTAQTTSDQLDASLWRASQKIHDAPKPNKAAPNGPTMAVVMPDAQPEPLLSSLSVMSLELRAALLAAHKKLPQAQKLFAQAAAEEKKIGYREPPIYIRPVGETEGLALLRAGDAAGAHAAYRTALEERPGSGFGLYGMARSSEAAGDRAKAHAEYAQFLTAWSNADPESPELAHARDYQRRTADQAGLSLRH